MKKLFAGLFLAWMSFGPAFAANVNIDALPAASSVTGTDLLECEQGGTNRKCTAAQTAAYLYGLMSGDATAAAGGAVTFATVNGNVGSFGSATACTIITVNAKGLITAASTATCTPAMSSVTGRATLAQLPQGIANSIWINPTGSTADMQNLAVPACANDGTHALVYVNASGLQCATLSGGVTFANPTATAGPTAVNGVATTAARSDSAPAIQKASNAQFGIMEGDGTTVTCTAGVCSAPPAFTSRTVTGTTDTILAADLGNAIYYNSASAVAITQPAASGSFAAGFFTTICQINNGVATVTPASGNIGGAGTYALPAGGTAAAPLCTTYQSDGTNFNVVPYFARNNTTTTASGTSALGTGAITSATCATVVTTSATGVATTDTVGWGFNGDPTAVTGYAPVTTGALTIFAYASSNNVNFKVCNLTTASITPGAITLNWRVVR